MKKFRVIFKSDRPNSLNGEHGIAWEDDTPGEFCEDLWLFVQDNNDGQAWCCSKSDLIFQQS